MSEELDTHDKMIAAFQEYFKWQTKFEHGAARSNLAGTKARKALSEIRHLAIERRHEMLAKQKSRKEARKGKRGRPKKVTNTKQ